MVLADRCSSYSRANTALCEGVRVQRLCRCTSYPSHVFSPFKRLYELFKPHQAGGGHRHGVLALFWLLCSQQLQCWPWCARIQLVHDCVHNGLMASGASSCVRWILVHTKPLNPAHTKPSNDLYTASASAHHHTPPTQPQHLAWGSACISVACCSRCTNQAHQTTACQGMRHLPRHT